MATLPLIRSNTNQSQVDSITAPNGLVCVAYTDQDQANLAQHVTKYAILDSVTSQIIVTPTLIADADITQGNPRLFILGNFFMIIYTASVSGARLRYIAVNFLNVASVYGPIDISTNYVPSTFNAFDGAVANNTLFLAWNGAGGSGLQMTSIASNVVPNPSIVVVNRDANPFDQVTVCVDTVNQVVYVFDYLTGATQFHAALVNYQLTPLPFSPATFNINNGGQNSIGLTSISSEAGGAVLFYTSVNAYFYDSAIPTYYTSWVKVSQSAGVTQPFILARSIGLASKPFIVENVIYVMVAYQSAVQSTYFLMSLNTTIKPFSANTTALSAVITNVSSFSGLSIGQIVTGAGIPQNTVIVSFNTANDSITLSNPAGITLTPDNLFASNVGQVVAKLAYQNGAGYLKHGLPYVSVNGNVAQVPYLFADLIQSVNKGTALPSGTQTAGIYSQFGINLASFTLGSAASIPSSNIGENLNLSGGFLWGYDGSIATEQNFFLYPDSVEATTAAGGEAFLLSRITIRSHMNGPITRAMHFVRLQVFL